jgi:hypothetical protein
MIRAVWENTRLRIGLISGVFFLCVAVVILSRAFAPLITTCVDAVAIVECAVRFSKTGVASSALFPGFTEVISDPHPYPEMRWWPTGIPKLMGYLLRVGVSMEMAYRVILYFSVALSWLGWFLVVKEAGRLDLLASNAVLAAGFCLCPLFLTPNLDIDEMVFTAFVPWVILLSAKVCGSRRWWLYLAVLQVVFLVSYYIRYASMLFPLVSMSAFGLLLLRKNEMPSTKTRATVSLVLSLGTFIFLLVLNKIYPPDLFGDVQVSLSEKLSRLLYSVGHSGYNSLFWLVKWFMPGQIVDFYEEILNSSHGLGYLSAVIHLITLTFVVWRCLQMPKLSKNNLIVFLCVGLLFINYVMVIYADVSQREYLNIFLLYFINYWHPYLPLAVLVMIFLFKRGSFFRTTFPCLVCFIPVLLLGAMVFGISKKPISLVRGFYLANEEILKERKLFIQNTYDEFFLPDEILNSCGIFYSQFPQFFSLLYPDSKLEFRPQPLVSEFTKYRTNTPLTVYFCLTQSEMNEGVLHPGVRKAAYPKSELLPLCEVVKSLNSTEDKDRLISQRLIFQAPDAYFYRFDLPADWRGKGVAE